MVIPSISWAKEYRLKQDRFQHLYKDFLKTKVTELANKLIVDPIIEEMKRNNVSEKIYQNVVVDKVKVNNDGIYINIHSEYFAESGFDVALAREEGTEDHWIRPKGKDNGGADTLSWISNGRRVFSKGHQVSGLPRLNIIELMIEKGEYELQTKLNEEFQNWKQSIFN